MTSAVMCGGDCQGCSAECAACSSAAGCFDCGGCNAARLAVLEDSARSARDLLPVLKFNPNQPRDADGQWSDGVSDWDLPTSGPVTFPGSSSPALEGKKAYKAAVPAGDAIKNAAPKKGLERDDLTRAVNDYIGFGAGQINGWLRTNPDHILYARRNGVNLIGDMIQKSPLEDDIVTYRGMRRAGRIFTPEQQAGSLVGAEWTDKAFSSTSTNPEVGDHFASGASSSGGVPIPGQESRTQYAENPLVMRLMLRKGTGAIALGSWGYEAEILLNRDGRYRVVGDHGVDDGGVRRIDVEYIEGNPEPLTGSGTHPRI
jgi:hypothetical protein